MVSFKATRILTMLGLKGLKYIFVHHSNNEYNAFNSLDQSHSINENINIKSTRNIIKYILVRLMLSFHLYILHTECILYSMISNGLCSSAIEHQRALLQHLLPTRQLFAPESSHLMWACKGIVILATCRGDPTQCVYCIIRFFTQLNLI